jgi:hypothetical protein
MTKKDEGRKMAVLASVFRPSSLVKTKEHL